MSNHISCSEMMMDAVGKKNPGAGIMFDAVK
jgi:hypothetical protein